MSELTGPAGPPDLPEGDLPGPYGYQGPYGGSGGPYDPYNPYSSYSAAQRNYPGPQQGRPVDPLGRPMAAWWKRALAYVIDIVILNIVVSIVLGIVGSSTKSSSTTGVELALAAVIGLGYFAFLDGSVRGQTAGKALLGIATRDLYTGGPIGAWRALVRRFVFDLLFALFLVPGVLNVLSPLWDRRRQAWHEKLGHTCVVDIR